MFKPRLSGITRWIMAGSVVLYVGQAFLRLAGADVLTPGLGLSVGGIMEHHYWQLFTYLFLHGSPLHLLFNMLMLYFLGSELEAYLGRFHYLALYLVSGILGGLGWLLLTWPYEGICVGASGALFGLLGGFALLFPQREVTLLLFFVFPITLRAWVLATVLGLVQFFLMISPDHGGIAYAAHLAGGVAGAVYVLALFRQDLASAGWALGRQRLQERQSRRASRAAQQERAALDRLLDKVARHGLHNLSPAERRQLEEASARLRDGS